MLPVSSETDEIASDQRCRIADISAPFDFSPQWSSRLIIRLDCHQERSTENAPTLREKTVIPVWLKTAFSGYNKASQRINRPAPITDVVHALLLDRRNLICKPNCCSFSAVNVLESL